MSRAIIVDASTSAIKSYLYDLDAGMALAHAQTDVPMSVPEPGAAEVDAELWWDGLCRTVSELTARNPDAASGLAAVAVTNQQISCVFLDGEGKPVAPAYLWMDTRCTEEIDRLRMRCELEGLGTDWIFETTGIPPSDSWGLAKLLWFRSRFPEAYGRIRRVASVDAFLLGRLSGRFVTDETNACFFHMDIRSRQPACELLRFLETDPGLFPDIVAPGTVVGAVTREAAARTGLPEGLPVIAAASDQPCALLGMGAVVPGEAVVNLGTGTFFMTPLASPIVDARMMTNISAAPNSWLMMGTHYLTGGAMSWLRGLLGPPGAGGASGFERAPAVSFDELSRLAADTEPGANGLVFLPGLSGTGTPRWDPEARGLFAGLGLGHTAGHLARAVMESTGYGVRSILNAFAEIGISFDKLIISGGPTSSDVWRQALADVLQRPLTLSTAREATPLGAAMLAAVACGRFAEPAEAVRRWAGEQTAVLPRAEYRETYDRLYAAYEAWSDAEAAVRRLVRPQ
ncbi:xylulokinase [Cohnella massiliensis]|uniref:xylulokinase n=1 Tax=Cohnella massiliensis TaxID=1816691 RepID=UPI001594208B|nr:FGGY-family carbohydrate kinase [Cohnella massiliensis]